MTHDLQALRQVLTDLNDFSRSVTASRAEVRNNRDLSPEGRQKKEDELSRFAEETFEQLRDQYALFSEAVVRGAEQVRTSLYHPDRARHAPSVEQQLLDEMRLGRAVARAERLLAAGGGCW